MDPSRFDALARAVTGSRRRALAAIAAIGLGSSPAAARRRKRCPPHRKCPDGCCAGGEVCLNRRCYKSCPNATDGCVIGGDCGACFCIPIGVGYGWGVCVSPTAPCATAPVCDEDADCLAGELCLLHGCCATPRRTCWRVCDA